MKYGVSYHFGFCRSFNIHNKGKAKLRRTRGVLSHKTAGWHSNLQALYHSFNTRTRMKPKNCRTTHVHNWLSLIGLDLILWRGDIISLSRRKISPCWSPYSTARSIKNDEHKISFMVFYVSGLCSFLEHKNMKCEQNI